MQTLFCEWMYGFTGQNEMVELCMAFTGTLQWWFKRDCRDSVARHMVSDNGDDKLSNPDTEGKD